jgi:AraC-like DNA-binding protein
VGAGPDLHAHFAIQLALGMSHCAVLRQSLRGAEQRAAGWLVGSQQAHWVAVEGVGVTMHFDPLSESGRRLSGRLEGVRALTAAECAAIRTEMEECWARGWQSADLMGAAGRIVDLMAGPDAPRAAPDPRVWRVLAAIRRNPGENTPLADLAAMVNLSEGRLAHLFRGMGCALDRVTRGRSLTEAAHAAGFADSAHFCRICRRMFGSAPSRLPELRSCQVGSRAC